MTPALAAAWMSAAIARAATGSISVGCVSSQRSVSAFTVSPSDCMVGMKNDGWEAS